MSKKRQSDELTLEMVRLRSAGMSAVEISRKIGKTQQFVTTATNRVRRADVAESDEPKGVVDAAYW